MKYIPNSGLEHELMLESIGIDNVIELFKGIPKHLILNNPLNLPPAQTESELIGTFKKLAEHNYSLDTYDSFLGAGTYNHIRPVIIDSLISRSEFYTSYTPYQPEINQGTVHSIYEFQTMICQLTGMEVANASMYDGSSALAEAVLMAVRVTKKKKIVCAGTIHPEYIEVVKTYAEYAGIEIEIAKWDSTGCISPTSLSINNEVAAVIIQSPNFFGCIEDIKAMADIAHQVGALLITNVVEPISLGIVKSPGALGADIVVGEGQSFGLPPNFGGPFVGFFATREQFQRQIPGRLVGQAFDKNGNRGFTITLATREQHIRREKATSNICTNEALCALVASIYLSTVGRRGLQEVALRNIQKANYALQELLKINGIKKVFTLPIFNEFVIEIPTNLDDFFKRLLAKNILPGLPLNKYFPDSKNQLLVCITENTSRYTIDKFVQVTSDVLSSVYI